MHIKNCLVCKKEFRTFPYLIKKDQGKYCSRGCRNKDGNSFGIRWMKGNKGRKPWMICPFKKGVIPWNKGLRGVQSGEKAPNWRGGRTALYDLIRGRVDYLYIMALRKEMDNYTCQICGKRGGVLHTDHYPVSFAKIIIEENIASIEDVAKSKRLMDINNLRTLCVKCHRQTKTYGRPARESCQRPDGTER